MSTSFFYSCTLFSKLIKLNNRVPSFNTPSSNGLRLHRLLLVLARFFPAGISNTSFAPSTTNPRVNSSFAVIRILVVSSDSFSSRPNFLSQSITGVITPRRFMTPYNKFDAALESVLQVASVRLIELTHLYCVFFFVHLKNDYFHLLFHLSTLISDSPFFGSFYLIKAFGSTINATSPSPSIVAPEIANTLVK